MFKYRLYKTLRFFHLISKKKFKKKTAEYSVDYRLINKSSFFDGKWYKKNYPDVRGNPIVHYLTEGWQKGYQPSSKFDGNGYLEDYPDVKKAQMNPLVHYERFGKQEKRIRNELHQKPFIFNQPNIWDKLICRYKNKTPKISIIVTSYNYQNYIRETLVSLVNQTYRNFEIIIVDDGSTDNSVNIINEYVQKYDFIHLYQHENAQNKGLHHSMALGLSKSTGEYVAFCESDDYWDPTHLEEKVNLINRFANPVIIVNDVCVFGCYQRCLQLEKNVLEELRHTTYTQTITHLIYSDFHHKNYIPTLSCCMLKKSALKKCDFLSNPRPSATDWWLYRQLIAKGHNIYYINKPLTFWRMHNSYNTTQDFDFRLSQQQFNEKSDIICHQKITKECNKDAEIIRKSAFFDTQWYQKIYNIKETMPELHYLYVGWRLGYNPSEKFNGNLYLSFYDDVKRAQINPLLHYEKFGKNKRLIISTFIPDIDILILTTTLKTDGVYIWRVNFIKEMLSNNGLNVEDESLHCLSPDFLNKLYGAKLVIFNRPVSSGISLQIIRELIRLNKKFIVDIDDLLVSDYAAYSGRYKSNGIEYNAVLNAIYSQSLCFDYGQYISVSTPYLADVLHEKFGKPTILMPNIISKNLCKEKRKDTTQGLKILYPSGTMTHTYDVSTVYLDLLNILLKYSDVSLTILGQSQLKESLKMFKNRICVVPYCSFENMLDIYTQHDLVIVPLDDNPFNNAKSNIKYIEAGAVGTPVIAKDCDEFKSVIQDGVNGFLYHDNFYEKFEEIYLNREKLSDIGRNAFFDVCKNHSTGTVIPQKIEDLVC